MLKRRPAAAGSALIEALVALLVLSVGILGLLSAQLRNLAEMQTVAHRAQAVQLIDDLAERVRAHGDGLARLRSAHYVRGWDAGAEAGVSNPCDTQACSADELASWDVAQWRQRVASSLPHGSASLFVTADEAADTGNRRQLGVMVGWRAKERFRGDPAYAQAFRIEGADTQCPDGFICHVAYVQP